MIGFPLRSMQAGEKRLSSETQRCQHVKVAAE
jgi:hypothetical protein